MSLAVPTLEKTVPWRSPEIAKGRDRDGYVYFILAGDGCGEWAGLVKIGFSGDPHTRRLTLSSELGGEVFLLGVLPNSKPHCEGAIHTQFSEESVKGEWFRADPALLAYIEGYAFRLLTRRETRKLGPKEEAAPRHFITIREAADLLKFTHQTVQNHCRAGTLPAAKFGKRWLIRRADLFEMPGIREEG